MASNPNGFNAGSPSSTHQKSGGRGKPPVGRKPASGSASAASPAASASAAAAAPSPAPSAAPAASPSPSAPAGNGANGTGNGAKNGSSNGVGSDAGNDRKGHKEKDSLKALIASFEAELVENDFHSVSTETPAEFLTRLKNSFVATNKQKINLKRQVPALNEKVVKLQEAELRGQAQLKETERLVGDKQKVNEELQKQVETLTGELQRREKQLVGFSKEVIANSGADSKEKDEKFEAEKKRLIDQSNATIQALRKEIDTLKETHQREEADLERRLREEGKLEKDRVLQQHKEKHARQEDESRGYKEQIESLVRKQAQQKAEVDELTAKVKSGEEQKASLVSAKELASRNYHEIKRQYDSMKEELEKRHSQRILELEGNLKKETDGLTNKLSAMQKEIAAAKEMQKRGEDAERQRNDLSQKHEDFVKAAARREAELKSDCDARISDINAEMAALRSNHEAAKERLEADFQSQLNAKKFEVSEKQKGIDDLQKSLTALQEKVNDLSFTKVRMDEEMSSLMRQLDASQRKVVELNTAVQKIEMDLLNEQLKNTNSIAEATLESSTYREKIMTLTFQLNAEQRRTAELVLKVSTLTAKGSDSASKDAGSDPNDPPRPGSPITNQLALARQRMTPNRRASESGAAKPAAKA